MRFLRLISHKTDVLAVKMTLKSDKIAVFARRHKF